MRLTSTVCSPPRWFLRRLNSARVFLLFLGKWHFPEKRTRPGSPAWDGALIIRELKLKLIFMSVEVEEINLWRLKIEETFNLWGRNARINPVTWPRWLAAVNARSPRSLLFVCEGASASVCGHGSCGAAARPHRFHALFSHLFTSSLQLTSLLPVARGDGSPQQPAAERGSGWRPREEKTSCEGCVRRSCDGRGGFQCVPAGGFGVDGGGAGSPQALKKVKGVC